MAESARLVREKSVALDAGAIRRLIEGRSGDAALLYLFRKLEASDGTDARTGLGWSGTQLAAAESALRDMGLLPPQPPFKPSIVPPETTIPDYSRADVAAVLERDTAFAAVLQETERKLGRLSDPSMKKLLGLYDYLGLPADVILLLIQYCAERKAAQCGEPRPPTMREIEKEGYLWARRELFTLDAADAYLRCARERSSRFAAYMEALGLGKRAPVSSEEKYLAAWLDWGFPPETVAVAQDRTVLNCHEFKWAYCNGILKRWHEKGLHTPGEALAENNTRRPHAITDAKGDKNAWMDEFIR